MKTRLFTPGPVMVPEKVLLKMAEPIFHHRTPRYEALFAAINKNTSELYFERVNFDRDFAERLEAKGNHIILSEEPNEKEFAKDFFKCKWCDHKEVCHEFEEPEKNCRTCEYSDLEMEGKWSCSKKEKQIPEGLQRKGCSMYVKGWGL